MSTPERPLCACGCGELAPIAKETRRSQGWVKGQPLRCVQSHHARIRPLTPPDVRFWRFVDKGAGAGCWQWTGVTTRGYGRFTLTRDTPVMAHRWAYEALVGPIPAGLTIDHLCRNPGCVNPAHMEPVTQAENNRRAALTVLTNRCKNGHEFTPENTAPRRDGRVCRTCRREKNRAWRARRKSAAVADREVA